VRSFRSRPEQRIRRRRAASASILALSVAASAARGQGLLELEWAWTLPKPSAVPALLHDIDGDGRDEILLSNGLSIQSLRNQDGDLEQIWTTLPLPDRIQAAVLAPSPSGTGGEIVAASGLEFRTFDASSGQPLRSFSMTVNGAFEVRVADIEGDAARELIACSLGGLEVYDLDSGGSLRVNDTAPCETLAVEPFDADPQLDLLVSGGGEGVRVYDGVTLQLEWSAPSPDASVAWSGQLDGSGPFEIVTTAYAQPVRVWSGTSGVLLWEHPGGSVSSMKAVNLAGDEAEELAISFFEPWLEDLIVLDGRTGLEIDSLPWARLGWMSFGQLDDDSSLELVWADGTFSSGEDRLLVADVEARVVEAASPEYAGGFRDLHAGRLAPSGPVEIVALASLGAYSFGPPAVVSWESWSGRALGISPYPQELEEFRSADLLGIRDLDDHSPDELVIFLSEGQGGVVARFDRGDDEPHWTLSTPPDGTLVGAALTEIDGDSELELVLSLTHDSADLRFYAFAAENAWLMWGSPFLLDPAFENDFEIGDVVGDETRELVYSSRWSDQFHLGLLSAADGSPLLPPVSTIEVIDLELVELDADPELEIVASDATGRLSVLDPETGEVESVLANPGTWIEKLEVADWTLDGVPDFAALGIDELQVIDGATGSIAWTAPFLGNQYGMINDVLALTTGTGGRPRLAVASDWGLALFRIAELPVFADGFESGDTLAWSVTSP
jgi:hypothetical protein